MIPSDIRFDANATPPQWTDNGDQTIEKGTNVRVKIKGLRTEVDKTFAIGTMKEVCAAHVHGMLKADFSNRITLGPSRPEERHSTAYDASRLHKNSCSFLATSLERPLSYTIQLSRWQRFGRHI